MSKPLAPGTALCINSKGYHNIFYQDWGSQESKETMFCLHGLTRNSMI